MMPSRPVHETTFVEYQREPSGFDGGIHDKPCRIFFFAQMSLLPLVLALIFGVGLVPFGAIMRPGRSCIIWYWWTFSHLFLHHYPSDNTQDPSDNTQTPSRHHRHTTDTPSTPPDGQYSKALAAAKQDNTKLTFPTFFNTTTPRQHAGSLRQHPDTLKTPQTTPRHPPDALQTLQIREPRLRPPI